MRYQKNPKLIPKGMYCYTVLSMDAETGRLKTKVCPYWSKNYSYPNQMNGYCSYLREGDWQSNGSSLLWDQVKSCSENLE